MKKLLFIFLAGMLSLNLTGCSLVYDDSASTSELEYLIIDEQDGTITTDSSQTPQTTETPQPAEPLKPINERILCIMCYIDDPRFNSTNTQKVDTATLYEQYDKLTCCVCGAVDGEDYKAGDLIYVLNQ